MTTPIAPCPPQVRAGDLCARRVDLPDIPRTTWDRLLAATACPSPFSRWTVHRAWWDAYAVTAHPQYLVVAPSDRPDALGDEVVAIVPLMHRHPSALGDDASATHMRRPSDGVVAPDAPTVFMAASYHADYATFLCDPDDLPAVCEAVVRALEQDARGPFAWDAIDLRRLRAEDPVVDAMAAALRAGPASWRVEVSQEDVCPVVRLPGSGDWDEYLATLGKKARHEIRRKLRRAEAAGEVRYHEAPLEPASVEAFIDLHQARWGEDGLFPATEGGDRSRRFLHRLSELEAAEGPDAQLQLGQVTVGDRLVFAGVGFDDGTTCYFYNAGADPSARELSPGVTGTAAYLRDRMAAGRTRFDFLRGDEAYKYEWGALDEAVMRILVTRAPA
ncbi:MAG: GNAT family N-acetyltransferase [Chloroflexi bacterium]|nr:GNAT family N-acetyltransferase [Chloroflexota bacterium]